MLARALYRQPQFLFLDEASSHLDLAREHQVTEAVRRLPLARIIVAHRLKTMAGADRVWVLREGVLQKAALLHEASQPGGWRQSIGLAFAAKLSVKRGQNRVLKLTKTLRPLPTRPVVSTLPA